MDPTSPKNQISNKSPQPNAGDITQCLKQWSQGSADAFDTLMVQVYDELHQAARYWLGTNPIANTLPPTAMVSELYLRLTGLKSADFHSREQFFSFTGILLRQILVDYARAQYAKKRGGHLNRLPGEYLDHVAAVSLPPEKIIAIHEALTAFEKIDPRRAKVIELRFFAGFKLDEIATALEVSKVTISRDLATAKLWLARRIGSDIPEETS